MLLIANAIATTTNYRFISPDSCAACSATQVNARDFQRSHTALAAAKYRRRGLACEHRRRTVGNAPARGHRTATAALRGALRKPGQSRNLTGKTVVIDGRHILLFDIAAMAAYSLPP